MIVRQWVRTVLERTHPRRMLCSVQRALFFIGVNSDDFYCCWLWTLRFISYNNGVNVFWLLRFFTYNNRVYLFRFLWLFTYDNRVYLFRFTNQFRNLNLSHNFYPLPMLLLYSGSKVNSCTRFAASSWPLSLRAAKSSKICFW